MIKITVDKSTNKKMPRKSVFTQPVNGGDNWLFGGEIIAASENYFDEFYGVVNKYLGKK